MNAATQTTAKQNFLLAATFYEEGKGLKGRLFFFVPNLRILINEGGVVMIVPESLTLDLSYLDDVEKHLSNIGFINEDDCVVMQDED